MGRATSQTDVPNLHEQVNLPKCAFCAKPVDPEGPFAYRKVVGWERKRDQGGTNAIRLRVPQPEFACEFCINKETKGINARQGSLL